MKKQKQLIKLIATAFMLVMSISVWAQTPTYNCRIANAEQVSCNVYEFDVQMQRTGGTAFRMAMFQLGININPAIIPVGGIVNVTPIPGSSTISNPAQIPAADRFAFLPASNLIQVTPVSPPGYATASIIQFSIQPPNWTTLFRLRVACSLPWVGGLQTNPVWSFSLATGYQTKIFAYNLTYPYDNTDITVQTSHTVATNGNPTLSNIGVDPTAQTVTSDMTNVCQLPGNGATISLASTQAGYTYYLYVDGVAVSGNSGVVFGTGSAASFTHKVSSGVVSVKSPSCSGVIDMLNTITLTPVTPLNASVSIAANPGNVVIPGTSVTYTATPVNGGTTPVYQWYVNSVPDLVNGLTETYIYTPADGDQVYCELYSSEPCFTPAVATSSTITMIVAFPPTPYALTGATSYCQGSGGVVVGLANSEVGVTYTLYKNTVAQTPTVAGTGSAISFGNQLFGTYTVSGTNPGGTTVMTGSLVITETPTVPVSVALGVDLNNLCTPVPVLFTATPTNGGTPTYQWYLNGAPTGSNQPTYSYTPANGDQVYVMMTSDVVCPTGNPATSSTITMAILPTLPASVSVGASQNNICDGVSVNFTANPTNGGATPSYQWYVNAAPVGTNQATYSYAPANGDQVYVVMTSAYPCVTGNPATSTTTTMIVNPLAPVSVSAAPDQNNICAGTTVTFTATPVNGGTPSYQWYKNSLPVGSNQPTYAFVPANLDQVSVVMTSSLACVSGNPATSGSTAMIVDPCTGIESNLLDVSSLYVYPNPSSDKLYVNFNELAAVPQSMKVFNAMGQLCFETQMPLQVNVSGIDVARMSPGTYTLQIVFENGTVNKPFVVN